MAWLPRNYAAPTVSATRPFYKWRAKFGGMQAGEATRLRVIETENAKLKKLPAEAHMHIEA